MLEPLLCVLFVFRCVCVSYLCFDRLFVSACSDVVLFRLFCWMMCCVSVMYDSLLYNLRDFFPCVCACGMYVCMRACMYVHTYVCITACAYVYCMHVCMYACMHVCVCM